MARIRTVKPEWLDDEALASLGDSPRVLSIGLILLADDYGNGRANPLYLASRVWGYEEDSAESLRKLAASLGELAEIGFVDLYEVGKQKYYHIHNWARHQRVDNAGKPRVPGPEQANRGESAVDPPRLAEGSPRNSAGSRLDHDHDHEGRGTAAASAPRGNPPEPVDWIRVLKLAEELGYPAATLTAAAGRHHEAAHAVLTAGGSVAGCKPILRRWLEDPWVQEHMPPLSHLAKNLAKYTRPTEAERPKGQAYRVLS